MTQTLLQPANYSVSATFLPDLEYRQQLLSSLGIGVLGAPKLRKFVGGRGSAQDPAEGAYDGPQTR